MRSSTRARSAAYECRAWETYYRRKWAAFLVASVGLVRAAFGMSWPRTLVGAWLVLRANQVWAPFPDNDPDAARRIMTRFYQLLRKAEGTRIDPVEAARLEVEWWRAHREAQHGDGSGSDPALVAALRDLYAYSYGVDPGGGRARGGAARRGHGHLGSLGRGGLRSGQPDARRGACAARALLRLAARRGTPLSRP